MSTSTTAAVPSQAGTAGVSFVGVLKSEWIKFRSLMSTRLLLILALVAVIGVGAMAAWLRGTVLEQIMQSGGIPRGDGAIAPAAVPMSETAAEHSLPAGFEIYGVPNAGLQLGILILGALAVLFISSEFATGMIRSTFTAVPKRLPAFAAKAIVLVAVSYVLTIVAAFITFLISIPILKAYGVDMDLQRDGVLRGILLGGLYVAGVALIGLSMGALLRNSAGGIIILVALFFVMPFATQLLGLVPGEFWQHVNEYVPSVAGGRMLEIGHRDGFIDPGAGALIFVGWILLFLIPAVLLLKKRDV
ncbi:ABC transporter permease [Paenarthrobacter sp. Z7-10]|uniref:ABC transporter permease n=1 Tax=Paenarthrobacter sp. Z7-10 TaxID=2787635 RepID=UPI0022A915D0|nr:ABC transporter permease [Paenarthrobacter sp. Z7-10]MCZ2401698.1 ABC transporter permease [Paenarthrobacter sp. Z7-10]